jgi:hypothetical protein
MPLSAAQSQKGISKDDPSQSYTMEGKAGGSSLTDRPRLCIVSRSPLFAVVIGSGSRHAYTVHARASSTSTSASAGRRTRVLRPPRRVPHRHLHRVAAGYIDGPREAILGRVAQLGASCVSSESRAGSIDRRERAHSLVPTPPCPVHTKTLKGAWPVHEI